MLQRVGNRHGHLGIGFQSFRFIGNIQQHLLFLLGKQQGRLQGGEDDRQFPGINPPDP